MRRRTRLLAPIVVSLVGLCMNSCSDSNTYLKWQRHFEEIARNPQVVAHPMDCLDNLGFERTSQLLSQISSDHACFAYDGGLRFAQIHKGGFHCRENGPSDALVLSSLDPRKTAVWRGQPGIGISQIQFADRVIKVTIFRLNPQEHDPHEARTVVVTIPWQEGSEPDAGTFEDE